MGARRRLELQWSHVFSDMVRDITLALCPPPVQTSMEPCLFRHGKNPFTHLSTKGEEDFNGAMSFQTW